MSSHHMNPFDFVPFADQDPALKTVAEWRSVDEQGLVTGYLDLQLKAETPVHIVGWQESAEPDGLEICKSHFCRRGKAAFIPGSSIRGMLRAFLEAACNGWVSQISPYHLTEKNTRNLAFMVLESDKEFESRGGKVDKALKLSLPKQFVPQPKDGGRVDLASFLFGYVSHVKNIKSWRGAIRIEDAIVKSNTFANCFMPDIAEKAFMGNPNPSAKTWWYHLPYAIRKRRVKVKKKWLTNIEFLGEHFRGRKFYYHQDPARTVPEYKTKDWKSLYQIKLECIRADQESQPFRIYFEEIPLSLLYLLLWAVSPGRKIRHKIGYGKAYGFGTVLFKIVNCDFRKSSLSRVSKKTPSSVLDEIGVGTWNETSIANKGFHSFIDWPRLQYLYKILYYEEPLNLIFTYPKFTKGSGGFLPPVTNNNLTEALNAMSIEKKFKNGLIEVTPDEAYHIAEELKNKGIKPALHFELYQSTSHEYKDIQRRKLEDAI